MPSFPIHLTVRLNAKLQPLDRGDLFEDPLDQALRAGETGGITGGGTQLDANGEIAYCDMEIELKGEREQGAQDIIEKLETLGAPKGSWLKFVGDGDKLEFGVNEGLGVYLNGSDLPAEVYETTDVNFVYSELNRLCNGWGQVMSHWEGPSETALYLYGPSFEKMKVTIQPLLDSYPLCQQCRVQQIA